MVCDCRSSSSSFTSPALSLLYYSSPVLAPVPRSLSSPWWYQGCSCRRLCLFGRAGIGRGTAGRAGTRRSDRMMAGRSRGRVRGLHFRPCHPAMMKCQSEWPCPDMARSCRHSRRSWPRCFWGLMNFSCFRMGTKSSMLSLLSWNWGCLALDSPTRSGMSLDCISFTQQISEQNDTTWSRRRCRWSPLGPPYFYYNSICHQFSTARADPGGPASQNSQHL